MSTHVPGKMEGFMQVIWLKYIRKFRFDPKMPMSSFMKIVKEDYMYEISKYQST